MGDLISREAAIAEVEKWVEHGQEIIHWTGIKAMLEVQPAVDAVPVVRCRECRHWRQEVSPTEHWVCAHHSFNERKMYTTPVFYCADGERGESE